MRLLLFLLLPMVASGQNRRNIPLDDGWISALNGQHWRPVDIPHNWDDYGGYRRLRHGNLHGFALYRRNLVLDKRPGLRYFLWFEGVGSYATVSVNGNRVGYHAGGRTSFTVDITEALRTGHAANVIDVRADHPALIRDLPWVCGGCSDERGFSEGSQPLGIFRPVHLVITAPARIEPFGVHIWNDTTISERSATLQIETEIKNYGKMVSEGIVMQQLIDAKGVVVGSAETRQRVAPGETVTVAQQLRDIPHPHLWSVKDPYLYSLRTLFRGDAVTTAYGIRRIHWPDLRAPGPHPFLLNGQPVFINGIAGYEHRIGNSHAFTAQEIRARVEQMRSAGFNAFRDAHQPHNLRYQRYWDSLGVLWWPQLSAHIWFDTPAFRENFKRCLTEWIKERRNSPSVILWGLQNESKLPEEFAKECVRLIRKLDPTATTQRLVVTCNGGSGTDWDVPQNWTGTYGGDPATYAADLRRQVLVGEYGAWRTIDLHGDVPNSEDRMCRLMETKIRLADSVKGQVAGHFAWIYSSHDNPGRVQSGEGLRDIDRIGPVNYKGLLTSWEEPVDAYYMFRSNFVPAASSPMAYIVRGERSPVVVYSNCDSVELFNDVDSVSLGTRTRSGIGTHFQWDGAGIRYNVLYAVGWFGGRPVVHDCVVLRDLRQSPHFGRLVGGAALVAPARGYRYLYRVNCGGPDYTDHEGLLWMADRHYTGGRTWGSLSWTDDYKGLPPFFASQRWTADPISGTADWPLFQDFRYGLGKLTYIFPVQDGDYRLELYFAEPWLGAGGGLDCKGWRLFDVAVNGKKVLHDLDIWKEAGRNRALKKVISVHVTGGKLVLSFPHVEAGQAIIDALAIATTDTRMRPAPPSAPDTTKIQLEPAYDLRPVTNYKGDSTLWHIEVGVGDKYSLTVKYRWVNGPTQARLELRMADGTLLHSEAVELKSTPAAKWNYLTATTGTMINAGHYTVRLVVPSHEGLRVGELQVQ